MILWIDAQLSPRLAPWMAQLEVFDEARKVLGSGEPVVEIGGSR